MKIKNGIKIGLIGIAIVAAGIGTTIAYSDFTDQIQIQNDFTIGTAGIEVSETNFDPTSTDNIIYGKDIPKNPVGKNIGNISEYIKLDLYVPVENEVSWVDKDNNFHVGDEDTYVDIFKFKIGENWVLVKDPEIDSSEFKKKHYNYRVYSYLYTIPVKPDESTPAIFETVTMNDITHGQINGNAYDFPVKGYAIQSDGFTGESVVEQIKNTNTGDWVSEPDED